MTITTGTITSAAGSAQNSTVTDANGDVYTAIIKNGTVSGGSTGVVNIEIHKYSQSSGTWSQIASLADGLNITPTTYFSDAMALEIDDSGHLGIAYAGRANIQDANSNTFSTARGIFHRELDLSNNQWGSESDIISIPVPNVWTAASDSFSDVRLAYDSLGNAVVGYERSFNSGVDQGKQAIFVAQQSSGNWNTSEVAKDLTSSAHIAEIGYMVKSGNNVYLSYTKGDGSYLDVKLSSSQDWTASTTIIDSNSDTNSYNLWGMSGNSNGSLNILYTGGGAGGQYDNASFGVISNTSGSWQLASDLSTRIANADGFSPGPDEFTPGADSVDYDRFFNLTAGAQGYLVTNSSNQSFFLAYYGTYYEAKEWTVWAKIGDNWIKGYNNIPELNSFNFISKDFDGRFTPVVINGDQLMFTYSPSTTSNEPRTVEYVTGEISDFVATGPSVTSIVRTAGADSTVQHDAASVSYTVTFSESVSGVSTSSFTLTESGNATGSIASVTGSGSTYTVTVNSLAGDGTLRLDLKPSGTGITGSGSIAITGGYTSGNTYTLDHTAPATPSVPAMDPASDTGASSSDRITNQASPTFTGTAEAGSTVTLYDTDGTTVLGSAVATGGNWSIVPTTPLSQSNHNLTARATDAAGNPSGASSALAVVIDTAAPTGFGLDKTSVPAASTGSNVAVATLQSSDASSVDYALAAGNGTNNADNGSFAIVGNQLQTNTTLAVGSYQIYLSATDAAGNVSYQAQTVTVVTGPTVTDSHVSISGASGESGAFKFGDTVTATWNNGATGDNNVDALSAVTFDFTQFGGGAAVSATQDGSGLWSASYTLAGAPIDATGRNVSVSATSASGTTTLQDTSNARVDTQLPSVNNVGASTADGAYKAGQVIAIEIAFAENVMVTGTPTLALSNGATASYVSGSGTATLVFHYTVAANQSATDLDLAGTSALALNGGTLRDTAGNNAVLTLPTPGFPGSLGANKNIVIDTTAPAIPAITSAAGSTLAQPTLSGTAETGSTVTVAISGATFSVIATDGTWSIDLSSDTPISGTLLLDTNGHNAVAVTATDAAGNMSTAATQDLQIDTDVPDAPLITSAELSAQSQPTLSGTAEAGTTVSVTVAGATYTTVAGDGTWRIDLATAIPTAGVLVLDTNGANAVSVTATDVAGNVSDPGTQTLTIDTTAPTQTFSALQFSHDTGDNTADFITRTAAQTITATLSATLGVGEKLYASLDGGNNWLDITDKVQGLDLSWDNATLSGSSTLRLKVIDAAGNEGAPLIQTYELDATAPVFNPVLSSPADNAAAVATSAALVLDFGERLGSADATKILLHDTLAGTTVAIAATIDGAGRLVITPAVALKAGTAYHLTWDADAIVDVAGNAAAALADATAFNFTTAQPVTPTEPTTPTEPSQPSLPPVIVDGASVTTTTRTDSNGVTTTTTRIAPVAPNRNEDPNTSHSALADVPLAKDANGNVLVQVGLPTGVGVSSDSSSGANLTLRDQLMAATSPRTLPGDFATLLQQGIDAYVPTVGDQSQVMVRTLTFSTAPGATASSQPIVVQGTTGTGESDLSHPLRQEALVIDARALPAGSVLDLSRVEFAIVIGAVRVIGGEGRNFAIGDASAQTMILGADDDLLHGGGGKDTVGSLGGNDQVFGDAGNDIVFGGTGHDLLSGGSGNDRLDGGLGWDTALQAGSLADYTLATDGQVLVFTHRTSGEVDRLKSIEQVKFDSGAALYIADSEAEAAVAHIATHWLGRAPTAEQGAWAQQHSELTALQVAEVVLQAAPGLFPGRTAQELVAGLQDNAQIVRMNVIPELNQGTAGHEELRVELNRADVHLVRTGTDRWEGTSLIDGNMAESVDIERLHLKDISVALDVDGTAGQVSGLLAVLFGTGGLAHQGLAGAGLAALDSGMSVEMLSGLALDALQQQQGHAFTAQALVQLLWTNATGSVGTQQQLQPFVQQLQTGEIGARALVSAAAEYALAHPSAELVGVLESGLLYSA